MDTQIPTYISTPNSWFVLSLCCCVDSPSLHSLYAVRVVYALPLPVQYYLITRSFFCSSDPIAPELLFVSCTNGATWPVTPALGPWYVEDGLLIAGLCETSYGGSRLGGVVWAECTTLCFLGRPAHATTLDLLISTLSKTVWASLVLGRHLEVYHGRIFMR